MRSGLASDVAVAEKGRDQHPRVGNYLLDSGEVERHRNV
jgi:hypothetical protein